MSNWESPECIFLKCTGLFVAKPGFFVDVIININMVSTIFIFKLLLIVVNKKC